MMVGTTHASMAGRARYAEKWLAVTAPSPQRMSPVGSPMTVKQPPQLAASTTAEPTYIRWREFCSMLCIMTSMVMVVVRLSRLAERIKVASVMVHRRRLELRVRIHSLMKSKQPLLFSSSTMDIVASRNMTMAAALPTYFRKTLL